MTKVPDTISNFYSSAELNELTHLVFRYHYSTGLLYPEFGNLNEMFEVDFDSETAFSIFDLRSILPPDELSRFFGQLRTALPVVLNNGSFQFNIKLRTFRDRVRWFNFKIGYCGPASPGSLAPFNGRLEIIVENISLDKNKERFALIASRFNSLNERRRRNKQVKAVIDWIENEQEELAVKLHDELGANLARIKSGLKAVTDSGNSGINQNHKSLLHELTELCQESITHIRTLYGELAPSGLKEFGLAKKIQSILTNKFRSTDIKIHFTSNVGKARFPDFIELNYFRIAQQLLDNVQEFSRAENVYVILRYEYNRLILMVADDGIGFNPNKAEKSSRLLERNRKGNGLQNIKERCKIINSSFTIFTAPQEGCRVTIEKEIRILT